MLSLAIVKTASKNVKSLEAKGRRLQRLNARRVQIIESAVGLTIVDNAADSARAALIQHLGKLADKKIRAEI